MSKTKKKFSLKFKSKKKFSLIISKIKKVSPSLAKNLSVFLLGIVFIWLFFELALFVYGKTQRLIQLRRNTVKNGDEFVILCIGESTTASLIIGNKDLSWPGFLDDLLNKAHLSKNFKVVNEGIIGINSTRILDSLEANLEKYHPDLVISMMGINDIGVVVYEETAGIESNSLLSKSRVYRLIKFLITDIKDKIKRQNEKIKEETCDSDKSCMELAEKQDLDVKSQRDLAVKYYNKALEYNPFNAFVFADLSIVYSLGNPDVAKVLAYSKKALDLDKTAHKAYMALIRVAPKLPYGAKIVAEIEKDIDRYQVQNGGVFIDLSLFYEFQRNEVKKDRLIYLEKALALMPDESAPAMFIARYYREKGDLKEAEKFYLKILENLKVLEKWRRDSVVLVEVAQLYHDMGQETLADSYWQEAYSLKFEERKYNYNYSKIYEILNERNIPLIAVQYPLRNARPLELSFKDKPDVFIVDNEQNFKDLVKEKGYDVVFADSFAGDFGHLNKEYNEFLAKNIKSTIIKNWGFINENSIKN